MVQPLDQLRVLIERREFRAAEQELLEALDAVPTYGEATLTLASLRRTQSRALSGNAFILNSVGNAVQIERWVNVTTMDDSRARFDETARARKHPRTSRLLAVSGMA